MHRCCCLDYRKSIWCVVKTCSSYPKVVASVGIMFSVLTTVCFCQAASNVDRMATFHVIARIQDQEAAEEGVRSRVCY